MKKLIIFGLVTVFIVSTLLVSVSCKAEVMEETTELAEETQQAETTALKEEKDTAPTEKTKLVYLFGESREHPFNALSLKLIEEFNNRTDVNATIEFQEAISDEYYPRLNTSIAAGATPDIFMLHAAGKMQTYVDSGILYPLNDAFEEDPEWKNRFISGIFDLMTFEGNIYAVPNAQTTVGLFYNKEIFARYDLAFPENYEDLKNVIKVLTDNGITPFSYGALEGWEAALFAEIVANRIGGDEPFDAIVNGTGSWEDPSFIQSGEIMVELAEMGAFGKDFLGVSYDNMEAIFNSEEAAMIVMGSWVIGSFTRVEGFMDKVGVAKFPSMPGGKGDINTWLGMPAMNYVISESCPDKESALKFLKMWSEPEVQKFIGEETGNIIVTNTELDISKVPAVTKELTGAMEDMTGMFIFYDVALGPVIGDEYNRAVQAILGGKNPATVMKELQEYTEENREEQ